MEQKAKKKMSNKTFKRIWISVLAVVLVLVLTANVLMLGVFQTELNTVFGINVINHNAEITTEEGIERGRALGQRIMEEGAVLLENDGVLPFDTSSAVRVNLLGYSSVDPVLGGGGSGNIGTERAVDFKTALESAGFEVNQAVYNFYKNAPKSSGSTGFTSVGNTDFSITQPDIADYVGDYSFERMKEYSDIAIIVLGRLGGEGNDLPTDMGNGETDADGNPKHYLELSDAEVALIEKAKETFSKVVVLINAQNAMELGFLDNASAGDPNAAGDIDAALWICSLGETGAYGVANLLNGTANPSGRLTDTYAFDALSAPAMQNFGHFSYTGFDVVAGTDIGEKRVDTLAHFVNYAEGIYIGYRWYETAAVEGVIDYDATVQYPFGYGLSYTTFSQELTSVSADQDTGDITAAVTVTNTGDTAGKEVVQLYYTAPYYEGGIEKAHVNLAAYGKTALLAPGESEEITLTFNREDMASYDYINAKAYVLEHGDYEIKLMKNAHEVIDSETYTVDADEIFNDDGVGKRSDDAVAATNQFDFAAGDVEYMSRANDFANRPVTRTADVDISADTEMQDIFSNVLAIRELDDSAAYPTTGASNGLKLADLTGLDYDDPKWDTLLDQMSVEDMNTLVGMGGWSTAAVESVGKLNTNDIDGPGGLSGFMAGLNATGYPSTILLASSFNADLCREYGETVADEANAWGISGWYAPGANLHRTPFSGRNFEYFSEDSLLTGLSASNVIQGAMSKGIYCYLKHFALNDQETNRCNFLCTWSNEQAIRELYLKPFEIGVKEGGTTAIMSSFNFLGTTWAGGCKALLTNVLRGEWGFQGMVITDACIGYGYMDASVGILAGNDLSLMFGVFPDRLLNNPEGLTAVRNACHNILYTQANSGMVNIEVGMSHWIQVLLTADAVIAVLWVICAVLVRKRIKKHQDA
ncbi:MAG: glycoside hydrolase family 3 N-terminal domain-containing protein [Candidatus Onthomonas sp.]